MKFTANKLKKDGLILSKESTRKSTERIHKELGVLNIILYDNYVCLSPDYISKLEIQHFLKEEYPNHYKRLMNQICGSLNLTAHQLAYAIEIEGDSELLQVILKTLKLLDDLDTLNKFHDYVKFKKRSDTVVFKPNISITSRVQYNGNVDLFNQVVLTCLENYDFMKTKSVDCSDILVSYVKETYSDGVSVADDSSIFFKGKSSELDNLYVMDIISGVIKGDTPLAIKLFDIITNYYINSTSNLTNVNGSCMQFEESIFMACLNNMLQKQEDFRSNNPDYIPLQVTPTSVVYGKYLDTIVHADDITETGLACMDYYRKEELPLINMLNGFNGEFIAVSDLPITSYRGIGSPIRLRSNKGTDELYYSIRSLVDEHDLSPEPIIGVDVTYVAEPSPSSYTNLNSELNSYKNKYSENEFSILSLLVNRYLEHQHTLNTFDTILVANPLCWETIEEKVWGTVSSLNLSRRKEILEDAVIVINNLKLL